MSHAYATPYADHGWAASPTGGSQGMSHSVPSTGQSHSSAAPDSQASPLLQQQQQQQQPQRSAPPGGSLSTTAWGAAYGDALAAPFQYSYSPYGAVPGSPSGAPTTTTTTAAQPVAGSPYGQYGYQASPQPEVSSGSSGVSGGAAVVTGAAAPPGTYGVSALGGYAQPAAPGQAATGGGDSGYLGYQYGWHFDANSSPGQWGAPSESRGPAEVPQVPGAAPPPYASAAAPPSVAPPSDRDTGLASQNMAPHAADRGESKLSQASPAGRPPASAPRGAEDHRGAAGQPSSREKILPRARPYRGNTRVDLRSVPSPCRSLPAVASATDQLYRTCDNSAPLSITNFVGIDNGNANPKFLRMTFNRVPHEEQKLRESEIQLAAILSPLYQPLDPREVVPLVTGRPPIRCKRCRSYISCHAVFKDLGRLWVCPLCDLANEVPHDYFCNLDASGQREDRESQPELCRGSVEFDVDAYPEYAQRDPKGVVVPALPQHHLFLIDITAKALSTFLPDYVHALKHSLSRMAQESPQCQVSFITYGSSLHFYNLFHPQMPQLIVADVDNPFIPLPSTELCWLTLGAHLDKITHFLDRIPTLSHDLGESDSAMGAAVRAAWLMLSGFNGGRVIACGHKAPQKGIGAIKLREQHKLYGTDREKELLRPIEGFWTTTATELAKSQIVFDLLLFADEYSELVTLGYLCHITNGKQHVLSNYDSAIDHTKLAAALNQILLEEAGYAGVLRLRCSAGLRLNKYHGHFLRVDPNDMDLVNVQGSSSFVAELAYEGKLDAKQNVYLQAALLYTTRSGHRRVRIHSFRSSVSTTYEALFREADLEAVIFAYIQDAIHDAVNKGPKVARQVVSDRVVKMLVTYRRYCTTTSNSSQLLLPDRLRLAPLFVLCATKSDALSIGTAVRIDERVQCLFDLMGMPVQRLINYLYPQLYAVHNLLLERSVSMAGVMDPKTGRCTLPSSQQLTTDTVLKAGVYLLVDEQMRIVYLWIGSEVSRKVLQQLFNTADASVIGKTVGLEQFSERLQNIIGALTASSDGLRRLMIMREGENSEESFFRNMMEDASANGMQGYGDLLLHLHQEVNKRLA